LRASFNRRAGVEDGHEVAVGGHGRDAALEDLRSHGVEADVYAAALGPVGDGAGEVLTAIVDDELGAEGVHEVRLVVAADRGGHARAGQLGELDGHMPDAAGAGVDQHLCPGWIRARSCSASQAVISTSGAAAASTKPSDSGFG
jgi:hypothetical protein